MYGVRGRQGTPHPGNLPAPQRYLPALNQASQMQSTTTPYTPATLASIKEYETTIKELQNENWQLKLRIFYLTQSVDRLNPEDGFHIKENIEQKVTIEKLQKELEEKNALLLEARAAINRFDQADANRLDDTFTDLNDGGEEREGTLARDRDNLIDQQRKLEEEKARLEQLTEQQAHDMENLAARLEACEQSNRDLESSLQMAEETVRELQEQLHGDIESLDAETPRKQKLRAKIGELEKELHDYGEEMKQRNVVADVMMLAEYEETIKFYEQRIKSLEDEKAQIENSLRESDERIIALTAQNEHLLEITAKNQTELESLRAQVSDTKHMQLAQQRLEDENQLLKDQIDSNLKMMEDYLKTMEQMGGKYKALQETNKNLMEENRSLTMQLSPILPQPSVSTSSELIITPLPLKEDHPPDASSTSTQPTSSKMISSTKRPPGRDSQKTEDQDASSKGRVRSKSAQQSSKERETERATASRKLAKLDEEAKDRRRSKTTLHRRHRTRNNDEDRETEAYEEGESSRKRSHRSRNSERERQGKAKEEYPELDDHTFNQLVKQIQERDDFLDLIVSSLKELHKACSQGTLNEERRERSSWMEGEEIELEDDDLGSLRRKADRSRLPVPSSTTYAFSTFQPKRSSSPTLQIGFPPSHRDFKLLSVALVEQKLIMEESFLLLASLIRKQDDMNRAERERLKQLAGKYRYESNSLKMQLKHFKAFYERGQTMYRTRSALSVAGLDGDESDDECDDGEESRIYTAGSWRTRDEDDVTAIFNKLKSKLRQDEDWHNPLRPNTADENNQELLWALKEVQAKVERLQESNRVLTRELEEKRGLIEKINSLYKNIPQLLQSPTLPTFSTGRSEFSFMS